MTKLQVVELKDGEQPTDNANEILLSKSGSSEKEFESFIEGMKLSLAILKLPFDKIIVTERDISGNPENGYYAKSFSFVGVKNENYTDLTK